MWEANRGKAQVFLFGDHEERSALLIGSSLSARLPMSSKDKIYNLGLSGGSAMTGLELVSRISNPPKLIFVEINYIERGLDEKFIESVDSTLARRISLFRIENRPLNYFLSFMRNPPWGKSAIDKSDIHSFLRPLGLTESVSDLKDRAVCGPEQAPKKQRPPGKAFEINIKQKKSIEAAGVNRKVLLERIKQLQSYIDKLEQRGAKVVLFEMPVNPQLQKGKRLVQVRKILRSHFPPQYFYDMSKVVDFSSFTTSDGLHLAGAECQFFASHLRQEIMKQIQ